MQVNVEKCTNIIIQKILDIKKKNCEKSVNKRNVDKDKILETREI